MKLFTRKPKPQPNQELQAAVTAKNQLDNWYRAEFGLSGRKNRKS